MDVDGRDILYNQSSSEGDEEEEGDKFVEVNLYVEGEKLVDEIFVSLSECASLHPCDNDSFGDDCSGSDDEPERKVNKIEMERFEDAAEK